jgi:SagB-type dehydrogenase family enzyme
VIALCYHDRTKHHFNRFARSLGYLDWTTQPDPFRRYQGAALVNLPRVALAGEAPYAALFDGSGEPVVIDQASIGEFLRCSMGLSAWKQYGRTRWPLRVNPSSGNLHPTEAYLVYDARTFHYAPREHALEERCVLDREAWRRFVGTTGEAFLVGLTSVHWREAWKYGERAFRYCQHDVGHAIGTLRLAAGMLGWRLTLLPAWSDRDLGRLLGTDRDEDYTDAEREEPDCLAIVSAHGPSAWLGQDPSALVLAAEDGTWRGVANRLSADHVEWPIIDEVSEATRYPGQEQCEGATVRGAMVPGTTVRGATVPGATVRGATTLDAAPPPEPSVAPSHPRTLAPAGALAPPKARDVILSRRSAVAFDRRSALPRDAFLPMLRRLRPPGPPWDALNWPPQVHLVLFVHRVEGLQPGIYSYLRDDEVLAEWRSAMRPEFLWERVRANGPNAPNAPNDPNDLFLLVPVDAGPTAMRLSCDQEIAADGFFSLAMVARVQASLSERGEWFYRRLFWECGLIGQVLYLEAEAARARATGIGCFYDDPVHALLGLTGHGWQSLYHFSMGAPVDDARLSTEPGYGWEVSVRAR